MNVPIGWMIECTRKILELQDRIELDACLEVMMATSKQGSERKKTGQKGLFDLIDTGAPKQLAKIEVKRVPLTNQELYDFLESGGLVELLEWSRDRVMRFSTRDVRKNNLAILEALDWERDNLGGYMWITAIDLTVALGFLETAYKGLKNERAKQG